MTAYEWATHTISIMIRQEVLTLLDQYGWVEQTNNEEGAVTGIWQKQTTTVPPVPQDRNRLWQLQFVIKTSGLTVYISAPAINSLALNETVGPVDPLYHDIDSLTARLQQLQ